MSPPIIGIDLRVVAHLPFPRNSSLWNRFSANIPLLSLVVHGQLDNQGSRRHRQISFFFGSTYYRFVQRFGEPPGDLIWSDSLQLLANYLTGFTVQLHFASSMYPLTREPDGTRWTFKLVGICLVIILAFVQISAGIAQTILSYQLRSFSKLEQTKVTMTLQTASLACDVGIVVYLCVFLVQNKGETPRTHKMVKYIMMMAVIRGMLTAASSAATMILFLVFPDTYWFFLSLAPNSQLYMNSMLATLNMRQYTRDKALPNVLDTIDLGVGSNGPGPERTEDVSAVASGNSEEEEETVTSTTAKFTYPPPDLTATATA
ncbi:hypothetical protein B0H14DRAFT_3900666 [Mycena olivaceomarginata]|nr:hypothetical protein B0H14DRAFT_3900666 [Mycena olivaceomarginata]